MASLPTDLETALAERYRLERELGRGGMATVYLAHDVKHDRRVALKVLRPELGAALGPDRFNREIRLAAQLQHPHILPIHDSGKSAGFLWYTMPFVEGESLRNRLTRETQLPVEDAVQLIREVANALAYAHAVGVVHRDVKPENILLAGGHALLADFGIAKAVDDVGGDRLTATGIAVGTPAYMSPEQAAGTGRLDGRSDIYSLACVLYEMLAGQPPFVAPTPQAVLARHAIDPVPTLRTLRGSISPAFEDVVVKALAKVPADRFPTARAFVDALERPAAWAPPRARRQRLALVSAAGVLGLAIVAAFGVRSARGRPAAAATGAVGSIAVLPIDNLTGDTAQVYLADAMMDQLITDLAQIGALRVVARTSVLRYRGTTKSTADIGRDLHVDAVLAGSVQRAEDSLRVSVQLNSTATGEALWAQHFDGSMREVLRLQSAVAGAVAQQIQVRLTRAERQRLATVEAAVDPAAYQAYVRGRFWWNRRGEVNLRKAIGFFEQALEIDPTYGAAYSGLADSYLQLGYGSYLSPDEAFPKVRRAATRALELDSTLAEPHASLGFYNLYYEWDWAAADREFRMALALNPNYATAHEWYGLFLTAMGRLDEAESHAARAIELDPLSVPVASTAGWVAYYAGKHDEAERRLRAALAMDSLYPLAHLYLGRVYQARGRFTEAVAEYERVGPLQDWVPTLAGMGSVEAEMGRRRDARQILALLDSLARKRYVTAYGVALVYTALGDKDKAFAYLDKGVRERTHWLVWLRRDFRWAPLRDDPRFEEVAHRVGLPN
jgi:serine/threonine-protein kinase